MVRSRVIPSRSRHPFQHKRELEKVFSEQKYDVCHIHLSTASNIEPLKAAIRAGVRVIIAHVHSSGAEGGKIAPAAAPAQCAETWQNADYPAGLFD